MPMLTTAVLFYVLSTTPVVHVRFLDRFSDNATCEAVITAVKKHEESEPVEDHIASKLHCALVSWKYDPDGDGPSKPVNAPTVPFEQSCKNPVTKATVRCKQASYNPLPASTE